MTLTDTASNQEFSPSERQDLIDIVKDLSPWIDSDDQAVSPIRGCRNEALKRLNAIKPTRYAKTRNHLDGDVTRLSPYVSRGLISLHDIRDKAFELAPPHEKFMQQLAWRDYWHGILKLNPHYMWEDAEAYKTGFKAQDYADDLPSDIATAKTGVACIDQFLTELCETGWVHNHARLYLAAYVCHWRRVKWQAGAQFLLTHLLDADVASNNLSWQWVASTFSHKPYYFNLENVQKFSGDDIDTRPETNRALEGSYEDLAAELFPNMEPQR